MADGVRRNARAEGRAIVLTLPRALADQYNIKPGTILEIKPFQPNIFIVEVKA